MKKRRIPISKDKLLKGNYLFQGTRLEGKVRNLGIKPVKKIPRSRPKTRPPRREPKPKTSDSSE